MKTSHGLRLAFFLHLNCFLLALCGATWGLAQPLLGGRSAECIQIFHAPGDLEYPIYLQNLLGHFPQFNLVIAPIDTYQKSAIEHCRVTIYLGTEPTLKIPRDFLSDFESTQKQVAWLGYSVEALGEARMAHLFGHRYLGMAALDQQNLDSVGRPSFFRTIHYKGEAFEKYGDFAANHEFRSSYPMALLERVNSTGSVLAEAENTTTQEIRPYIIRNQNHFYVADNPLTYRHERDRYLVLADLLFDILDVQPLYPDRHPALIRIEDVNVTTPLKKLTRLLDALREVQVPAQIALVPIFADPLGITGHDPTKKGVPLDQPPGFAETLRQLQASGTSLVWHGVTHQYGDHKNPVGVSVDDYEFLVASTEKPIPEDSVDYVLNLMNRGWNVFDRSGLVPLSWEVPHYAASALDYYLFARLFHWNYGKIRYVPHQATRLKATPSPMLWFEKTGLAGDSERRSFFEGLRVIETGASSMQFFPYEIYKDSYGQSVMPENLGYPHAAYSNVPERTLEMIFADAKRNRVIRDSWASFYLHVSDIERINAQFPEMKDAGLTQTLAMVQQLKQIGYDFQSVNQWIRSH